MNNRCTLDACINNSLQCKQTYKNTGKTAFSCITSSPHGRFVDGYISRTLLQRWVTVAYVCLDQSSVSYVSSYSVLTLGVQDADLSVLHQTMAQCCKEIKETVQMLASRHKDIHGSVSKVGKAIDRVRICSLNCICCCSIYFTQILNGH